jgi:hypothetical protein
VSKHDQLHQDQGDLKMSNTRRIKPVEPKPPENIRALAAAYECGHCNADKSLWHDGLTWRLKVAHDLTCPVYLGTVSRVPQLARAMNAADITHGLAIVADPANGSAQ